MEEIARFERRHRLASVIHLGFFSSVVMAFLVSYMMSQAMGVSLASASQHGGVRRAVYGAAFVLGLGVILLRRWFLSSGRLLRLMQQGGSDRVLAHLMRTTIVLGAASEAIALMGFALSMITRIFEDMWRVGGIGGVLLLYTYPWRAAWRRVLQRVSST